MHHKTEKNRNIFIFVVVEFVKWAELPPRHEANKVWLIWHWTLMQPGTKGIETRNPIETEPWNDDEPLT